MIELTQGDKQRLERIATLRGWVGLTEQEMVGRAIAIAWIAVERHADDNFYVDGKQS